MVTEYEIYIDERYQQSFLMLGGLICTEKGRQRLSAQLTQVREQFGLNKEMRWGKVSTSYLDAYKVWIDVFLDDRFARFALLRVDRGSDDWKAFTPRKGRSVTQRRKISLGLLPVSADVIWPVARHKTMVGIP